MVVRSAKDDSVVAILSKNGKLTAGATYTLISYISSADEKLLRTVPMPADSPRFADNYDGQYPLTYYNPSILSSYTQLPKTLDPNIKVLSQHITANAPTMYDKVIALETYLRNNFTYDVNVHLPNNEEAVSWFLFRSPHKGFCNYFSTTMAVMARSLGIPARVVVGYTNGHLDEKHHQRIMYGTDAHSWTQVYFAGYGWVNFEPSAGFSSFTRPTPGQFQSSGPITVTTGGGTSHLVTKNRSLQDPGALDSGRSSPVTTAQAEAKFTQRVGIAFGSVILLILFSLVF